VPIARLAEPALLTDQVFASIRGSILNGELPAGYRLRIRDLADRVGTSVMPVREAIQRLEEAGLAERVPHRGAVVKGLTLHELVHVYDVRRVLETEAARQGAATITPADLEQLQQHYDAMRAAIAADDPIEVLDQDEALLNVLYQASGNPVLTTTIKGLWVQCRIYKLVFARANLASDDTSPLWQFQEGLLDAARRHDSAGAAEMTSGSLLAATDRIRGELLAHTDGSSPAPVGLVG
jgi:DNA-binding GntR family transcriptional regulator